MQSEKQTVDSTAATISPAADAARISTSPTTVNIDSAPLTRNQMRPVKYDYADSFACTYIVSVVAASNAELVTYPLDLTKTRLQIQGEAAAASHRPFNMTSSTVKPQVQYRGMFATAIGIVREEGTLKLWQGVTPALYRHIVYSGVRICTYDFMRKELAKNEGGTNISLPLYKSAMCGVFSGGLAQWLASPADLVKVQIQMEGKRRLMGESPRVHSAAHALKEIIRKGGIKGLWKGSIPNVQRAALVNLGDLTTYDTIKHMIMNKLHMPDCHTVHVLASICAGFVAAVMGTPADVVKTRIMNQPIDEKGRIIKMCTLTEGSIKVKANEINLDLTLLGGQSFRWEKQKDNEGYKWCGVAYEYFWVLKQNENNIFYKVYTANWSVKQNPTYYENLLRKYFRLDFNLDAQLKLWKQAHQHFENLSPHMKAVRVLNQEPLENIVSFICSQNNNIKRISSMIDWLCLSYGKKIGCFNSKDVYSFPTLDSLNKAQCELECRLREAKFGYRAKFIAHSIEKIIEFGGMSWFEKLRVLPYKEVRQELVKLPGIGFKVADCICLMSLGHLESVPIDTHIFKIAQTIYMPQFASAKTITPKIYDTIAEHLRKIYGSYAGWAQAVLFCSELQRFQSKDKDTGPPIMSKKKRCK